MDWPESGEITFCISHGSMGMAQINHAPMYYLQTRWAAVSDENGAGQVNAGVVSVISIAPLIADYPGDDEGRDQRAVAGDSDDVVGLEMLAGLVIAVEEVEGRALEDAIFWS